MNGANGLGQAMFDKSPLAMFIINGAGEVEQVNKSGLDLFTVPACDKNKPQFGEVFHCVHADESPRGCGFGVLCKSCGVREVVDDAFSRKRSVEKRCVQVDILIDEKIEHMNVIASSALVDNEEELSMVLMLENGPVLHRQTSVNMRVQEENSGRFEENGLDEDVKLRDLINANVAEKIMGKLYEISKIPLAIIDLDGSVIVKTKWMKVCSEFHRFSPQACKNCIESDLHLGHQLREGEFRTYKCNNGLWDASSPLYFAGVHVGNVFSGQVFLDVKDFDKEFFANQAAKYNFDKVSYFNALTEVPKVSQDLLNRQMELVIDVASFLIESAAMARSHHRQRIKYDELLDCVTDVYFILDSEMRYVFCNKACQDFNKMPLSEIVGTHWSDIELHKGNDHLLIKYIDVIRNKKSSTWVDEYTTNSQTYFFEISAYPINDGVVVYARNITEQHVAIRERDISEQHLYHASKLASVGELAASIGHEINNPLAIIGGSIDLLRRNCPDKIAPLESFLANIDTSCSRIENIVSGLRTCARHDSDKVEAFDCHHLIDQSLMLIDVIYLKENIIIEREFNATQSWLEVNKGRLQQVIMNIFSNARDAFGGKKGRVKISTLSDDEQLEITVEDDGCGIRAEDMGKIWESFFTTKSVGKGTGLGLAISHKIITEMSGTVDIRSEHGKGTSVIIKLPWHKRNYIHQNKAAEAPLESVLCGKVLVVDNEDSLRGIISRIINSTGLHCDEAKDGVDALSMISEHSYDYIVTDIVMPRLDGFGLIRELRSRGYTAKIIAISGGLTTEDETRLLDVADSVICKPFKRSEIYDALKDR